MYAGGETKYLTAGSTWKNELGSIMNITVVDTVNCDFTGTYYSAVGEATNTYGLQGRFDTVGRTLGWAVSYKNKYLNVHSTCAWSGQIQLNGVNQEPVILSTWVLTSQTDEGNEWNSTNVGFDTFYQWNGSRTEGT